MFFSIPYESTKEIGAGEFHCPCCKTQTKYSHCRVTKKRINFALCLTCVPLVKSLVFQKHRLRSRRRRKQLPLCDHHNMEKTPLAGCSLVRVAPGSTSGAGVCASQRHFSTSVVSITAAPDILTAVKIIYRRASYQVREKKWKSASSARSVEKNSFARWGR